MLLLLLLLLQSVALALERPVADVTSRKLLTDRSWFSQVAKVSRRASDDAMACAAVSDPLRPGLTVRGYELVERSGLLGVCKHQQTHHTQWPMQSRDKMEIVHWTMSRSEGDTLHIPSAPVCPLPGAASASQRFPVPPLPPPQSTDSLSGFEDRRNSPEGAMLEYQYVTEEAERIYVNSRYRLKKRFDAGSHGEVWRAVRRYGDREEYFVLKRLFLELGESMAQMGQREAHFGALLHGERHVTRFVEYFFRPAKLARSKEDPLHPRMTPELWLIFYDEGKSLRQYLYEKLEVVNGADGHSDGSAGVVLQPSRFWEKLRTDSRGENVLREIMRQLLQGVAALHARGITHRDIKPSNILVSIPPSSTSAVPPIPLVKLADFGSAVDDYTLNNLYAAGGESPEFAGPSQAEETREYQPPEVLFSDSGQPYDYTAPEAYDLWSVGVVFLEIVLGSPQVFLISPRERAKLDVILDAQQRHQRHNGRGRHSSREDTESRWRTKAYLLHVLTREFCIFQAGSRQLRSLWDKYALVSESCHFGRFNQTVVERDPLKRGLEDLWGLDLIWRLLQWHPSERITAKRALQHAFFQGAYVCKESGRRFATKQELLLHESYLEAQRARESMFASVVRARYELPDHFACPKCGRVFSTAQSCEQHVHARRHDTDSSFCKFEASHISGAIRTEAGPLYMQYPQHPAVGIAMFQGRKKYMEDFVLVLTEQQLNQRCETRRDGTETLGFDLYAVVDGHLGSAAAAFVVENLPRVLCRHFAVISKTNDDSMGEAANTSAERELAEKFALRQTFLELHECFLHSLDEHASDDKLESTNTGKSANSTTSVGEYFSGCTLTVALHCRREHRVVSANVGDSRALAWLPRMSEQPNDKRREAKPGEILPLSMDHCPNDSGERSRIESSGGFVNFSGLWRVVGQLAVSRSLGDRHLRKFVTAEPSVFHAQLGKSSSGGLLVIASDGLWETMTNDDVVRFLAEKSSRGTAGGGDRHSLDDIAANMLTEGYVRGSLDNMAVVLVALS
ncbi:protein phosphatase 1L-like protein [Phytophthora infestans T30-4]|uniref:Protein phosphatase 1L-like protein n=2 Tax=Phytophthora infestans TaxID=4787 RepID=D0NIG5_PHYIT|nr:protein phosphatase 1L-like protein [Phytophthora infestans T30-4]EEY59250.1 protein phosphatase 1L-like protein [Phytophthora infestans T30-4]KAF4039044.1 Protein phosphatase 2C [Phytophthora infestans]KAF4148660.1 Protein phosphatase 2C [Phytophthora infestans]|eukprot:XP_002901264.1 protein phosphatase 1L-like protein [Phytophthora infestans T30-4]